MVGTYRDHHLSAYPGLTRDPGNPTPFFRRVQTGSVTSGRLRRDRAFFFASYEHTNQRGVVSVQPRDPAFAGLGGIFPSPSTGAQISGRVDIRLRSRHDVTLRYSGDESRAFAVAHTAAKKAGEKPGPG